MLDKKAETKNSRRLRILYEIMVSQSPLIREMLALVTGNFGTGKSTAVEELYPKVGGLYVLVVENMRVKAFLDKICTELAITPSHSAFVTQCLVIDKLEETQQVLFIDNGEALNKNLLNTIQAIHDLAKRPIFLIGSNALETMLNKEKNAAIRSRIGARKHIKFESCDFDDLIEVAKLCCEIRVEDDLLKDILKRTGGNMRKIIGELSYVETCAALLQVISINLKQYEKAKKEMGD
ncbi:ATP-binding protein [Leptolyngbya sp. NIES-2104]|uniref:ATP-binding protein n=1 Tax=Leptolyngbya sp. NIES-2104 TaxID=1552121 RepID=UPI0006EC8640|nr:ATP-binding protein [Leptolyngbya sp. NIES-2104]GAP96578.1 prophage MuSo1, DNA transposition protein, putative [Leptolyngbya sp. NIES-2104]